MSYLQSPTICCNFQVHLIRGFFCSVISGALQSGEIAEIEFLEKEKGEIRNRAR